MKLKQAMEEINDDPVVIDPPSPDSTSDAELIDLDRSLESMIRSLEEFDDFDENVDDTIQGLEGLYVAVEAILANDAATKETAELIQYALESQLARYGLAPEAVSLESFGEDYVAHHQAALESIRDNLNRFTQSVIVPFQRMADTIRDAFKDHAVIIQRVHGVYDKAESVFDLKRRKGFRYNTFMGSLDGFVDVYVTDRGFVKNIPDAMRKDLDMSRYVLTSYTKDIVGYADKLAGLLSSGDARSDDTFERTILSKLSGFKHPAELFDKRYLTRGEPYLYSTGIKRVQKKQAKAVAGPGSEKAYEKLSELATKDRVTHFSKKLARDILKAITAVLIREATKGRTGGEEFLYENVPAIELSEMEVRGLFKHGREYLDLVGELNERGRQITAVNAKLKDALVALITSVTDSLSSANRAALKQVQDWAQITQTATVRVSLREARRSLLVTRATSRLAGRVAANAR